MRRARIRLSPSRIRNERKTSGYLGQAARPPNPGLLTSRYESLFASIRGCSKRQFATR
jgi:hypothetical protein